MQREEERGGGADLDQSGSSGLKHIDLFIYINPPQLSTTQQQQQQQYDATEVKHVDLQSDVRKNVCAKIHKHKIHKSETHRTIKEQVN